MIGEGYRLGLMKLDKLKDDWESLAERDALGAILTDASRADGKWDIAEFFATGEAEMEVVMRHLASIGRLPGFDGAALDFGCGVGRVTQALARRFASCAGVDISRQMIEKADSLNQYPHCSYVVHSDTKLPFADGNFSFLYSNIVLQHVPPNYSERYLREFVRVLAPGGVLVFGVQDSFAAPDFASRMVRIRHVLHLKSRIQDALGVGERHMRMHCLPEQVVRRALGSAKVADVQFTNTAAKDFNGKLVYLPQAPASGYVGKQYCVVKEP
jgi:SAM-dependent methyltransferase